MSELSFMGKLMKAMELSKAAHTGLTLTYFDVIELSGEIESFKGYIAELEADKKRAEQMVERLIESGKPIAKYLEHVDYRADTFIEIVAEWQANQKGDSNV